MTQIPSKKAKKQLTLVWFIGAGVLFFVLLLQSMLGKYGAGTEEVWSWFLPAVVPTLTLIVGVLVSDALRRSKSTGEVDRFIFLLALCLSVVYLLTVGLPIFLAPLSDLGPADLMKTSRLWLVSLQGIVSAALGAFFVNKG